MVVKYGGVIFNHQHFVVFGESLNTSVTNTKLWVLLHKVVCWATKRRIKKILATAKIFDEPCNKYRIQILRHLSKLNKTLDCKVDGLFIDIDFIAKSIHISLMLA